MKRGNESERNQDSERITELQQEIAAARQVLVDAEMLEPNTDESVGSGIKRLIRAAKTGDDLWAEKLDKKEQEIAALKEKVEYLSAYSDEQASLLRLAHQEAERQLREKDATIEKLLSGEA